MLDDLHSPQTYLSYARESLEELRQGWWVSTTPTGIQEVHTNSSSHLVFAVFNVSRALKLKDVTARTIGSTEEEIAAILKGRAHLLGLQRLMAEPEGRYGVSYDVFTLAAEIMMARRRGEVRVELGCDKETDELCQELWSRWRALEQVATYATLEEFLKAQGLDFAPI